MAQPNYLGSPEREREGEREKAREGWEGMGAEREREREGGGGVSLCDRFYPTLEVVTVRLRGGLLDVINPLVTRGGTPTYYKMNFFIIKYVLFYKCHSMSHYPTSPPLSSPQYPHCFSSVNKCFVFLLLFLLSLLLMLFLFFFSSCENALSW